MQHHYKILGLKSGASQAEIKGAYRRLAKKYHPDICKEPDAEEKFIEITEAYDLLLGGGSPVSEFNFSGTEEVHKTPEEKRRERARAYANMRYSTFKKNNAAFQKSWYFVPVKYTIYLVILLSYGLAVGVLLIPLWAWLITRDSSVALPLIIVSFFSAIIFKHARDLHKGVKPYLSNYN